MNPKEFFHFIIDPVEVKNCANRAGSGNRCFNGFHGLKREKNQNKTMLNTVTMYEHWNYWLAYGKPGPNPGFVELDQVTSN